MKVQVVSFHCVLKNKLGQILSTSFNQDVLTIDESVGGSLPGLAKGLQGIRKGEQRKIFVPAGEAYGFYDLSKVKRVRVEDLSTELSVGKSIRIENDPAVYKVIEIIDGFATLDCNHPLAGQDLIFEIEATDARVATPTEVSEVALHPQQIIYH